VYSHVEFILIHWISWRVLNSDHACQYFGRDVARASLGNYTPNFGHVEHWPVSHTLFSWTFTIPLKDLALLLLKSPISGHENSYTKPFNNYLIKPRTIGAIIYLNCPVTHEFKLRHGLSVRLVYQVTHTMVSKMFIQVGMIWFVEIFKIMLCDGTNIRWVNESILS
jgi:hypothetical protein